MTQSDIAQGIAVKAHYGQTRRDKKTPYIFHSADVAARVRSRYADDEHLDKIEAVAWLHDVLEDTDTTGGDLLIKGIAPEVIVAVVILTKIKGMSYDDYLKGVKENELARKVKIADMLSNLSDTPTDKQIIKYAKGLQALVNIDTLN